MTAREADRKQVREQALREATTSELAAELLRKWRPANVTQAKYPDSVPFRAVLLALIEKDKTDECP